MNEDEYDQAMYDLLMEEARTHGLCPNCFHTLACCGDRCPDMDMLHKCAPNEEPA